MGLETANFINDLVTTNPVSGDKRKQGDDHLRLIKAALKATFPNADHAFFFPDAATKTVDFVVASTDMNKTYYVDTTLGEVNATLPSLTADDAGWECAFIKTNTGASALFIAPASGTLQSGEIPDLAKCRRCIPGHKSSARWSGTGWFISRVPNVPVGAELEFQGANLPVGYEWPNGQTLGSASTKYPEFYLVNGNSGVVQDSRGRATAGKDNMGGTSADRLTGKTFGVNGDTLGAAGGVEDHALLAAENGPHNHVLHDPGHVHVMSPFGVVCNGGAVINTAGGTQSMSTAVNTQSSTTGITIDASGSGDRHNNVQPTIIKNKILVVE